VSIISTLYRFDSPKLILSLLLCCFQTWSPNGCELTFALRELISQTQSSPLLLLLLLDLLSTRSEREYTCHPFPTLQTGARRSSAFEELDLPPPLLLLSPPSSPLLELTIPLFLLLLIFLVVNELLEKSTSPPLELNSSSV